MLLMCCDYLVGQVACLIGWINMGFDELTLFSIYLFLFVYYGNYRSIWFICVVVAGVTW